MKTFFLILLFSIITVSSSGLPIELQKEVLKYISINDREDIAQISLKKFYDRSEGLVFPSTSPTVFVVSNSLGDNYTQESLRELEQNNLVLPHLQLWFSYNEFRIDNDLKDIHTNITNLLHITNKKSIFFDGCADKDLVVLLTQRKDYIKISIRDLADNANPINIYCSPNPLQPLSLCLHNNADSVEYSFMVKNDDNTVQLHYHSLQYFFFEKFFNVKKHEIPIPIEFCDIKKHEFIGKNTFLMLIANQLFFAVLDTIKTYRRQHFFGPEFEGNGNKETFIEYDVISFAVHQGQRTPNGRARFIVILIKIKGDAQKKILLVDLLDSDNKVIPLWYSDKDNSLYDRISIVGNIVTLWVDDPVNPNALEIRLPFNWVDKYVRSELTLRILRKMNKPKRYEKIMKSFDELHAIESAVVPELKKEDLGALLLPKKRGNCGEPLSFKILFDRYKYQFFGLFCVVGLVLYSSLCLLNAPYQKHSVMA